MAWRVSRRRNERDGCVAEYVIVAVDDDRLTILQLDELVRTDRRRSGNPITEHEVALGLLNDPGRAGIIVPVPGMVSMRMGHGQVGNVGGTVSDRRQLASQGFINLVVLRASALWTIVNRVVQPGFPQ